MTPQPRRPGRPRKAEHAPKMPTVHLSVSVEAYDVACRIATKYGLSVNAVIRKVIERELRTDCQSLTA